MNFQVPPFFYSPFSQNSQISVLWKNHSIFHFPLIFKYFSLFCYKITFLYFFFRILLFIKDFLQVYRTVGRIIHSFSQLTIYWGPRTPQALFEVPEIEPSTKPSPQHYGVGIQMFPVIKYNKTINPTHPGLTMLIIS